MRARLLTVKSPRAGMITPRRENGSRGHLHRYLIQAALALACSHAGAGVGNISAGEVALMPEYCPDSLAFSPRYAEGATAARQRRWVAMMGESFWDIHHYCWAIAVINRSKLTGVDKQRREYMLRDAIDDITYVLRRARPDFVLLPEIYTRLGDVQQSRERPVDALYAYEQAVQSRADYWPAYVRLADLHASLGSNEQAVTVVERGLTVLPEQPQLLQVRNRLAQKSGKKSKP